MKDFREDWLFSLTDQEKSILTHRDFSKTEIEEIVNDLCINDELKDYAKLFYVKDMNISQVAETKLINWTTAKAKLKTLDKSFVSYLIKQYPYKGQRVARKNIIMGKL